MARIYQFLIIAIAFLGLSACQTGVSVEKTISFQIQDDAELAINARRLEIVDNWIMPLSPPYVEHELTPTPLCIFD